MATLRQDLFPFIPEEPARFTAPRLSPDQLDALEASGMTSLRRGYEAGRLGTDANYNLAREASLRADGRAAEADALRTATEALQRRQSIYAPRIGRVEEVAGVGDALSYAAGQIGQGAASTQDPLLASAGLSTVGTALAAIPRTRAIGQGLRNIVAPAAAYGLGQQQLKGEYYGDISRDPEVMAQYTPQELNTNANLYGAGAALLDTVAPAYVGRQLGGATVRSTLRPATKLGLGLLGEGVTETGQDLGKQVMHTGLNPLRDTSEDASNLLNSFVGGMVGGAGPASLGAGAEALYRAGRKSPNAVQDPAGSRVDLASGETVETPPPRGGFFGGLFGKKTGETVDLKGELQTSSQDKTDAELDRAALLFGRPPAGVDPSDAEGFAAWHAEAHPKRIEALDGALAARVQAGDAVASGLYQRLGEATDPIEQNRVADEAAAHLTGVADLTALEADFAQRYEKAPGRGPAARVGGFVGAVVGGVGRGLLGAGKAAWSAAGRKKNEQDWTSEEYAQRKATSTAAAESYQRAVLLAQYMADRVPEQDFQVEQGTLPRARVQGMMATYGAELASIAQQWKKGGQLVEPTAIDINRIALGMRRVYGKQAELVADALRTDPTFALPSWVADALEKELAVAGRPEGQAQATALHDTARGKMLAEIPAETQTRLAAQGIDLRAPRTARQVLGLVRGAAEGRMTPAERRQLTDLIGKDSLERILDKMFRAGVEEQTETELVDQEEIATTDSGLQVDDETGDVVDAVALRQADKSVENARPHATMYGYYNTSTRSDRDDSGKPRDPFHDPAGPSKGKILAFDKMIAEQKKRGVPIDELPLHLNPRLEVERPQLFDLRTTADRDPDAAPELLAKREGSLANRENKLRRQLRIDNTPEAMLRTLEGEIKGEKDPDARAAKQKTLDKARAAVEAAAAGNDRAKEWLDETVPAFFTNRNVSWDVSRRSALETIAREAGANVEGLRKTVGEYRAKFDAMTSTEKAAESDRPLEERLGLQKPLVARVLSLYRDYMRKKDEAENKLVNKVLFRQANGEDGGILRQEAFFRAVEWLDRHGMVVAERKQTNRDPQELTPERLMAMAAAGKKIADSTAHKHAQQQANERVAALQARGASAKVIEQAGILRAEDRIPSNEVLVFSAPVLKHNKASSEEIHIPVRMLAQFAKDARLAITPPDFEEHAARNRNRERLGDILDGITAVLATGLVEGMPGIYSARGELVRFRGESVPYNLQLATTTYGGMKGGQERGVEAALAKRKAVGQLGAMRTGPAEDARDDDAYQTKVAGDQRRGAEPLTPEGRTEIDPVLEPGARSATRPAANQRRNPVEVEPLDVRINRRREALLRQGLSQEEVDRRLPAVPEQGPEYAYQSTHTIDTSGEIYAGPGSKPAPKISRTTTTARLQKEAALGKDPLGDRAERTEAARQKSEDVVPSETVAKDRRTKVDDEFTDVVRRGAVEGRAAAQGPQRHFAPGLMMDKGEVHGQRLHSLLKEDFEAGLEDAKTWLRVASSPRYQKEGLVGGIHYVSPVAIALSGARYGDVGATAEQVQQVRALRAQVARMVLASDMDTRGQVKIARELALPEGRARLAAPNVKKFLEKVAASEPAMDLQGAHIAPLSRRQQDAVSTEAVKDWNAEVGEQHQGSMPSNEAAAAGASPPTPPPNTRRLSPSVMRANKDRRDEALSRANAAAAEGDAAPVGKTSARPSGAAGGRKLNAQGANAQTPSSTPSTPEQIAEAKAWFAKVLPDVKVAFKDLTGYSGEWLEAQNVVELANTLGVNTLQVAYHEGLHAFFSKFVKNDPRAFEVLKTLADDPKIMARVTALLKDHPNALAQLTDGEERLAYIYQFWAAGLLDLPTKKAGIFEAVKRFFHRMLGMITDQERATAILEAFHRGDMANPSVAGEVIAKALTEGTLTTRLARKIDAAVARVQSLVLPAQSILGNSDSPEARKLLPEFWTNPGEEEHGDKREGLLNAQQAVAKKYKNQLQNIIADLSGRDLRDVVTHLQQKTDTTTIAYAPHAEAVKKIRGLVQRFYQYMTDERGLKLGRIDDNLYFPRTWSRGALLDGQDKFIKMLMSKYDAILADGASSSGLTKEQVAQRIHRKLVENTVGDHVLPDRDDGVLTPFFENKMVRELSWLDTADSESFQSKDLISTLTGYFHQGARAAEYTARFGDRGQELNSRLQIVRNELLEAAEKRLKAGEFKDRGNAQKWAERRFAQVQKAVGAMEGTLGHDIGSAWRTASAWITVYENVRLLPLTLFASVVDPLGSIARGATMKEAYDTFLRGMREVFNDWGDLFRKEPKSRPDDKWALIAKAVGSVDAAMFSHHVADEYASVYMNRKAAKLNEAFFRLNGMEAWNRGVRTGATRSAVMFLERHSKLPDSVHSKRWLAELGLEPADIVLNASGELIWDKNELAAHKGISKMQAEREVEKIHVAIRRWVEGAVLTPNAAQRPSWGSDPHFSIFFHLKQFSYSFHQTIMKRAINEAGHGNLAPLGTFLWYVPVMIASDITKGLLQGGGSLPSHMQGMTAGDWILRGAERGGLFTVGQIGVDASSDIWSVAGPGVEQVVDSFGRPIGRTVIDALPARGLYQEALR